jgi:formate hydrogenlyase transcriptional activator
MPAVLIAGERGSEKELLSRIIHRLSPRRSKSFVKVDCATTARQLLKRELFGSEKSSFGAISDKLGLLESANRERRS